MNILVKATYAARTMGQPASIARGDITSHAGMRATCRMSRAVNTQPANARPACPETNDVNASRVREDAAAHFATSTNRVESVALRYALKLRLISAVAYPA